MQKELKLSPQQVQAIANINEQHATPSRRPTSSIAKSAIRRSNRSTKQTEAMIGQVISPQQFQRLTQISLQQQGTCAFERPDVIEGLGLTQEQLSQIQQIRDQTSEEMQELFRKQMEEIRKASEKKVVATFSPQQQAQWNQARGETFEGEIVSSRYGGPRSSSPGEQIRSPGEEALRGSSSSSSQSAAATPTPTTNPNPNMRGRPTTTQRSAAMNAPAKKPTLTKTPAKTPVKKPTTAAKKPTTANGTAPAATQPATPAQPTP